MRAENFPTQAKARSELLLLVIVALWAMFLSGFLSGCANKTIEIELASKAEKLPFPQFVVADKSKEKQLPYYSEIRVYHLANGCVVPKCALIWQMNVPVDHSPKAFVYGGIPGFGSMTVVPHKALEPGNTYMMQLGHEESSPAQDEGEFIFKVNDEGVLEAVETSPAKTSSVIDKQLNADAPSSTS